jgi:hypothetical protein
MGAAIVLQPDKGETWFADGVSPPVLLAELVLPDAMPPRAQPSTIPRDLAIALGAWEKISGYENPSRPDRLTIRDFAPVPLADGTVVIPGLGVRLRETVQARTKVIEIVDIQEYGPIWSLRSNPAYQVGALLGGTIFSIDQNLRTALSKSGQKKLNQGFSFPIARATPYKNHKGEDRVQIQSSRLSVTPMVRPRGRWLVAQPDAVEGAPTPKEELDQLIAEFRQALDKSPCAMSGREILDLERKIEILETASDTPLPFVNLRQERDAACAIATHGAYDLADLVRLAVLREASCEDLKAGPSDRIRQRAQALQREVAPPRFLTWSRIGLFGLRDPSRRNLTSAEGIARKTCVLDYLETDLFGAD